MSNTEKRDSANNLSEQLKIFVAFLMIFLAVFGVLLYLRLYRYSIAHVQGEHEMTLIRTELTVKLPDENGFLKEQVISIDPEDFTESGGSIFGFDGKTVFTPGCYTQAALIMTNKESYPVSYWIEIVFDKNTSKEFADQLLLTVQTDDGPVSSYLSEGLCLESETQPFATLDPYTMQGITITIELEDREDNDNIQGEEVFFDLIIYTVSSTK